MEDHRDDQQISKHKGKELTHRCLERAWLRFAQGQRWKVLQEVFEVRLGSRIRKAEDLWKAVREIFADLAEMLVELAGNGKSLLGDYRCLSA